MDDPRLICNDVQRTVRAWREALNGLDYLDVSEDQRVLTLFFFDTVPPEFGPGNVRIESDDATGTSVEVSDVIRCGDEDSERADQVEVFVRQPGDFSTYTLQVVKADARGRPGREPLDDFDPRYGRLTFSFKAGCPTGLDCAEAALCDPPVLDEPEISYLAKDYASFRQLALDRLALVMPDWKERHAPDVGIALVEVLAYVGDYLSYYQDAVATEAYLGTARRRISVRRHVRLIDYAMHEGCNARAWVCVEASEAVQLKADDFYFITADRANTAPVTLLQADLVQAAATGYEVFEPVVAADVALNPAHNEMRFWTWGDRECCLPLGSTRATLRDAAQRPLGLAVGDVIIFEEILGPRTGVSADADPSHRQAVRLTRVERSVDPVYEQPIVEIEWAPADALRFPLCISAVGGEDCRELDPVSVARGNVILVDHGRQVAREEFEVPPGTVEEDGCEGVGRPRDPVVRPPVFAPVLRYAPVTHRTPFPRGDEVAREQAAHVAGIPERVWSRVFALREKTLAGEALDDAEIGELATIFGERALKELGLIVPVRQRHRPGAAEEARALGRLVHDGRYLARKTRWLAALAARARAGYVLGEEERDEIDDLVGPGYAQGIRGDNPAYFGPARGALVQNVREALPAIRLESAGGTGDPTGWSPQRDLLASHGRDPHFVAEIDDEGRAVIRFGDDDLGRVPAPGATFGAEYRVGNGRAGNVGAEVISRIVFRATHASGITRVRNPLAAEGGTEPEPLGEVKLFAPATFRRRLARAITAEDYAALAGEIPGVQRAAAILDWNGSWYEARVAIDPTGSESPDEALLANVGEILHRCRRIGHDVVVQRARYVPLHLALRVCVLPHYLRAHVKRALLDVLGSRDLPGGRRGLFHPDNLSFGDAIYLSRVVAAAQAVQGVESVTVTHLERLCERDGTALVTGVLEIDSWEIAQLDNDPVHPERGLLELDVGGGR